MDCCAQASSYDAAGLGLVVMRSYDIVAYIYRADMYCSMCIVEQVTDGVVYDLNTAVALGALADQRGIDREDERSYDSGDFPKVVFADQIEDDEYCGACGDVIL